MSLLQKIIPYSKIIAVYKKNTAIVFSNAIEIVTRKTKVRSTIAVLLQLFFFFFFFFFFFDKRNFFCAVLFQFVHVS